MLIDCKYCDNKFAVNAEEAGFDGRLIKCENCQKEWFQESKPQYLEKKLIELDQNLHATEVHLIDQKNIHNDKIEKLENALKVKKEELNKQKLLEERIGLFEKRITETEKEIAAQALVENRIIQLEKEIKQNSLDSFVKNTNLEKKANYLQMKIYSEGVNDRLDNLENEVHKTQEETIDNKLDNSEKLNSIREVTIEHNLEKNKIKNFQREINTTKEIKEKKVSDLNKVSKFFFWKNKNKNINDAPVKKNLSSSQYGVTHPDKWDLSEETIERELKELKKIKKNI